MRVASVRVARCGLGQLHVLAEGQLLRVSDKTSCFRTGFTTRRSRYLYDFAHQQHISTSRRSAAVVVRNGNQTAESDHWQPMADGPLLFSARRTEPAAEWPG